MQRTSLARSLSWLAFFAGILWAWWFLYGMATGMGFDLIGRPGPVAEAMRDMDPRMDMAMPMARSHQSLRIPTPQFHR